MCSLVDVIVSGPCSSLRLHATLGTAKTAMRGNLLLKRTIDDQARFIGKTVSRILVCEQLIASGTMQAEGERE